MGAGGVIAGVLALVVGLSAWLLPDPMHAVCGLTSHKIVGCNDVPSAYLGTWKGRVTMEAVLVTNGDSGIDSVEIYRARTGEGTAAKQSAVDWPGGRGCSHTWQLESVDTGHISFRVTESYPNNPATLDGVNGCVNDITVNVQLLGHDDITITCIAGSSNPLILPPGTAVYQGTLHRVSAD